jgi:hypothetical protein
MPINALVFASYGEGMRYYSGAKDGKSIVVKPIHHFISGVMCYSACFHIVPLLRGFVCIDGFRCHSSIPCVVHVHRLICRVSAESDLITL